VFIWCFGNEGAITWSAFLFMLCFAALAFFTGAFFAVLDFLMGGGFAGVWVGATGSSGMEGGNKRLRMKHCCVFLVPSYNTDNTTNQSLE
jgi:hypothetical protein